MLGMSASAASPAEIAGLLDSYDLKWDVPGPTSWQSMPIGNGDIGLNVWVEPGGDLLFYIGKTDSWNDNINDEGLLKVGGVRVSLNPSPLANGAEFLQTLKLRSGEILIKQGPSNLRVWVDANNPVIHVEAAHASPRSMTVSLNNWRKPSERDVTVSGLKNKIAWYHRNPSNVNPHLANLTSGAIIQGEGFTNRDDQTLISAKPSASQLVSIYPLTSQPAQAAGWLEQLERNVASLQKLDIEKTRTAHRKWWEDFWQRSWVFVSGDDDARKITEGYVLQRFVTASGGRGAYPIKFNGSIFVVDNPNRRQGDRVQPASPDFRTWGAQYWFQNTRAMYWPRLAAGDYDIMMPLFRMYAAQLASNAKQVREYYKHDGSYFAETAPFWGGLRYWGPEVKEDWTGHYFTPVLELSMMMLDYYDYTGDKEFAKELLVPVATAGLTFFDEHFKRGADGKILLDPVNSIEMYWKVHNPAPDIAGLQAVLARMSTLPPELTPSEERTRWARMTKEVPALPTGIGDKGKRVIQPYAGPQTARIRNGENPELYAVYPFRLFGLGMPDLELAVDTFAARRMTQMGCWVQDPIQAAMLGLPDVAKKYTLFNLTRTESGFKFPAYWAHGNDYQPDQDNGGNGENGLQQMVVQSVGQKILVLPAWPKGWNAEFKMHAAYRTTVQGTVRDGKLVDLVVTPESRRKDVIDMTAIQGPQTETVAASPAKTAPVSAQPLVASDAQPVKVACVGDSIVYGAGIENRTRDNWPAVMNRWLGDHWKVRNFGLNGATMLLKGDLPYRNQPVFKQVLDYKPDVIVISLGGNDSKHPTAMARDAADNWRHKDDYTGDYKAMISAFREMNPNVHIFVCTPLPAYPGQWGIDDATIRTDVAPKVKEVAKETAVTVIDLYTALSGKRELFPDTVHPNAAGARLVATEVYRSLTGEEPSGDKSTGDFSESVTSILSARDSIAALRQTGKGAASNLAGSGDFGGDGNSELVGAAIDGNLNSKHFNKSSVGGAGAGSGFIVTPRGGAQVVTAIQFATANDSEDRDPLRIVVEGTNSDDPAKAAGGDFVTLYEGPSGMEKALQRNHWASPVTFKNSTAYKSYRVLVTGTRGRGNGTQYAEVKMGNPLQEN